MAIEGLDVNGAGNVTVPRRARPDQRCHDARPAPEEDPKSMPFDGMRMFYDGFKVLCAA
jgi:hypothetical protein